MRTVLLTATALAAFSSPAVAQDQIVATSPTAKPVKQDAEPVNATGGGRLHYDLPCRVSSAGTCINEPPPYRPLKK